MLNIIGRSDDAKAFYLESIAVARQLSHEYGRLPGYETSLDNKLKRYINDAKTKDQKKEADDLIRDLIPSALARLESTEP